MPQSKKGAGSTATMPTGTAYPDFTSRELEVIYKALSCIKEINDQGEVVIDFKKLLKSTEYPNTRTIQERWDRIKEKLAQNSEASEADRAALANNESAEDDNMRIIIKKPGSAGPSNHKRKVSEVATTTDTNPDPKGANDASVPDPKPKKTRAPKSSTSKKQAGKKRASKKPAAEEDEEFDGTSSIRGPVNNYGAPAYPIQQNGVAPQYANNSGHPYGLRSQTGALPYPNIGDAYGAQPYTFNNGAQQYPDNGGAFGDPLAGMASQQYTHNPAYAPGYSNPVGSTNTNAPYIFDPQAQMQFDNNFSVNDMFGANAHVPSCPPPTNYGFSMGTYDEYNNDDNANFTPWDGTAPSFR
ncbi:hypothetical protein F4859DRAFT_515337 [Xylaria cf. heliscus]|nr:hypothetical protein F4859DRAFT_515337 [Xylaria cf. heliscus]